MTLRIRDGAEVTGFDAPMNTNVEANSAAAIALAFSKTVEGLYGEVLYAERFCEDYCGDWYETYVLLIDDGALFEIHSVGGLDWRPTPVTFAELQERAENNLLYDTVVEAVWPLTGRSK